VRESHTLRDLTVQDQAGHTETVAVTDEHPYYISDRGWTPAGILLPGDLIATDQGFLTVLSERGPPRSETVYNLEIEGAHTFFVGHLAAWVHNNCRLEKLRQKYGHLSRTQ